jgi:hypothetical protein
MYDDRKKEVVRAPDAEWVKRDAGKHFLITEWGARRAEKWAWGIAFALKGSTSEIPLEVARLGMVGVGIRLLNVVLKADTPYASIEPFMDQLVDECVQIVRDPSTIEKTTGLPFATKMLEGDVSEIATLQWLRSEVIRVHTNFSVLDSLSALLSLMTSERPSEEPSTTETSPLSSEEPSRSTPA